MKGHRSILVWIAVIMLQQVYGKSGGVSISGVRWQRSERLGVDPALLHQPLPGRYVRYDVHASSVAHLDEHFQRREQGAALRPEDREAAGRFEYPLPNGGQLSLNLVEYAVLSPELHQEERNLRTFLVQGAEGDASIRGALTYTEDGWRGRVYSLAGTLPSKAVLVPARHFLRASARSGESAHVSYWQSDFYADRTPEVFECLHDEHPSQQRAVQVVEEDVPAARTSSAETGASIQPSSEQRDTTFGQTRRVLKLILSATQQYALAASGGSTVDKTKTFNELTTVVNEVNAVYLVEFDVSFTLVNDQSTISTDATDLISQYNSDGSNLLNVHAQWIQQKGYANSAYNMGHVLSTGSGGVAIYQSVCTTNFKAMGTSGLPNPIGNTFVIDYVCHEMGHQFGASHTWNGDGGSCTPSAYAKSTAYEPGSASTIMGYAGICATQDLQSHSDPYFSWATLNEVRQNTVLNSALCGTPSVSPYTAVAFVNYSTSFTAPRATPFFLTAAAVCPGRTCSSLTYVCEEADAPTGQLALPSSDPGNGPILRSWKPTSSGRWSFPVDPGLGLAKGEIVPTRSSVQFVCTARTGDADGGQTISSSAIVVNVNQNGSPFVLLPVGCPLPSRSVALTWQSDSSAAALSSTVAIRVLEASSGKVTTLMTGVSISANAATISIPDSISGAIRIRVESETSNTFFSEVCTTLDGASCSACVRSSASSLAADFISWLY